MIWTRRPRIERTPGHRLVRQPTVACAGVSLNRPIDNDHHRIGGGQYAYADHRARDSGHRAGGHRGLHVCIGASRDVADPVSDRVTVGTVQREIGSACPRRASVQALGSPNIVMQRPTSYGARCGSTTSSRRRDLFDERRRSCSADLGGAGSVAGEEAAAQAGRRCAARVAEDPDGDHQVRRGEKGQGLRVSHLQF